MDIKKKDPKKEPKQVWTKALEDLLAEWSDKATCFRWLHSRSEKSYRSKNYLFTIPVIILSTLTGTANFAMDSFVPEENKQIAMACVGSVNIFAGILSTLQNFLRYAELTESHRLAEVSWSKFGRDISIELALDPVRRKPALDFLKVCRAEYDRLIEQSPTIDDKIIASFKYNFKDAKIRKPDICNGLTKCKIYEPSKEEKVANIMATATQKLSNKWKKPPPTNTFTREKDENMKELQSLCSMSRVSMFKEKLNNTEGDNPVEVINNVEDEEKIEVKVEEVVDEVKEEVVAENELEQSFVNGIK
jgi:hypothetical protein